MSAKVAIIIPARYQSSRFPGKPLALINGRPMIEHVYRRCQQVPGIATIIVATDDERIASTVRAFGGQVRMTSENCACGTDRVAEVAATLDADIIVNVQGDEPSIEPDYIARAIKPLLDDDALQMATLMAPITDQAELDNPNIVKVVTSKSNRALYFSRSAIPNTGRGNVAVPHKHIGLYVYRRDFLLKLTKMEQTPLEKTEKLEQLRVLENDIAIQLVEVPTSTFGVDTPEQLKEIEKLLQ